MSILIKLYGNLRKKVNTQEIERGLPMTLNIKSKGIHSALDILDKFVIEDDELSHIFVNGKYCGPGKEIRGGDRVGLFPKNMSLMFVEIPNLNSIYVIVKLFTGLRKDNIPKIVIEMPEGSTIKSVLKKLKIGKFLKEEKRLIFKVNGLLKHDKNFVMEDNDTLDIFPPKIS